MRFLPLLPALALGLLAPAALGQAADPGGAQLSVEITDIEKPQGELMIALFDEAGYASDKAVAATQVAASGETATATFRGLAPGRYGIKLFHDVNGNGKMDTNPFGMPTEPFAFSNNAPARFGPASWADAAFEVGATGATQTIKLN
ncbi:MAG: DUF2141 domain-containing protein [Hyphomonadaceae bacterium]